MLSAFRSAKETEAYRLSGVDVSRLVYRSAALLASSSCRSSAAASGQPLESCDAPARRGRRDLVLLSSAFFFIFLGPGATQQFLIPFLAAQTGRSHSDCSWILAAVYLSALVWALLCGYTVRWLGARRAIVAGLATYAGFSAAVFARPTFACALAAAVLWGWGAAAVWVSGPTRILENESPFQRGRASGIFFSAVFLGQAIGVIALGRITDARWIFGVAAVIGAAGVACAWFVRPGRVEVRVVKFTDAAAALASKRGAFLAGIALVSAMGFGVVLSPLCSSVDKRLGFGRIAELTIWFYVGRLVMAWAAGWLSDRWGRLQVLALAFLLGAGGLALAAWSAAPVMLAAAALALGMQAAMLQTPTMALVGDWIPPERRHLAFGALYAAKNLGVSFAILFGQDLREHLGGDPAAFGVFACIMACCAAAALAAARLLRGRPG